HSEAGPSRRNSVRKTRSDTQPERGVVDLPADPVPATLARCLAECPDLDDRRLDRYRNERRPYRRIFAAAVGVPQRDTCTQASISTRTGPSACQDPYEDHPHIMQKRILNLKRGDA